MTSLTDPWTIVYTYIFEHEINNNTDDFRSLVMQKHCFRWLERVIKKTL